MRRAFCLFAFVLLSCAAHGEPGLEYRWSTQAEWATDPTPAPAGDRVMFIRTSIPDVGSDGAVAFYARPELESVDIDGEPIDLGNRWAVHRLPPSSAHKTMTLRYRTRWPMIDPQLAFGSEAQLGGNIVRSSLVAWALGGALLLIGFGAIASIALRRSRAWFFFGLFAAAVGSLELLEVQPFYTLLPIAVVRDPIHEATQYLIACGFAGFASEVIAHAARPLRIVMASALACTVVMLGLHIAGVLEAKQLRPIAEIHIVTALVIALGTAFRADADRRTRIFRIGMIMMLVTAVPDLLSGLGVFRGVPNEIHTAKWGVAFFVLLLGYVLYGYYGENERALQQRVKDLEALDAELRHQIAERSREIARHIPEPSMSETPKVGATVAGRYEILRALGAGGMGQVFEVVRTTDSVRFALKVMHGRTASDAVRFAREAEIAAKIAHPNLVSVADVGIGVWGTPYIVMELVPGGTLADAELDRPAIRRVLREVARGLVALHDAHVVHRDLKPTNVLLQEADPATSGVKLADFGIAGVLASELDATQSAKQITAAGSFLGTPAYMAPELAKGAEHAGPAADIFSFGVMAYELFSGEYPFPTPLVFLALSDAELPPAPSFASFVDPDARAVLEACLSADPAKRPSAHALLAALK